MSNAPAILSKPAIVVHAEWDPEAHVFVAESADVPGLVTEGETPEALIGKLEVMIPELLAENGAPAGAPLSFTLVCERQGVTVHQNVA